MKTGFVKKDNNGISLVSLIITILVIIILASISFIAFNSQNQATFAKFIQEFEEVRKGVESKRLVNAKNDVENADYGFSKVYVSGDIPYNFISLDNDKNISTAYLVSLDYIGYDELTTGRDYPKFEQEGNNIKTVYFGKSDVYVYDSTGRLFYAKGFLNDGTKYFENEKVNSSINIVDVSTTKEGSSIKITIIVESVNEVKSVKVGDNEASKIEDGKYEINVYKNGNYEIVAEDVNGQKDIESVFVSGLTSSGAPVVTAEVTNGILENGVYIVHGEIAKIKLYSDTAKELYIGNSSSDSPNSWLPFAQNIEKYYSTSGQKDIYIYVKDENGVVNNSPCIVHILIELDEENEKPIEPTDEIVDFGTPISFLVTCSDPHTADEYSRTKYLQITYPIGKQSDGYVSMYRLSTSNGGFGRWTISYDSVITLEITKETTVEAKVIYNKGNINKESNVSKILINKIDRTVPSIKSLESIDTGNKTIIRGSGIDYESTLNDTPYLITLENIDFSNSDNVDKYTWLAPNSSDGNIEQEIIKDGRYYFYVRDKVNNVAVSSINVDVVDRTPPVIKASDYGTPVLNYVLLNIILTDETGVTAYAVTRTDTSAPTEWIEINEQEYIFIEYKVYEEGDYYIWAKDAAGNMAEVKKVTAKTYKFPTLDETYPKDVYIKEGDMAEYEVVITKDGEPAEYEFEWQYSSDSGNTWNTINGATDRKYSFKSTLEDNGKQYRCLIKHGRGILTSRAANLEVIKISNNKPSTEVTKETDMILGGVIINNGAEKTNKTTLSLEIVALNAFEMNISETSTQSSTWQKFEEKIDYELKNTTSGNKTIYVWIRDSNGNVSSSSVHAEIKLEK